MAAAEIRIETERLVLRRMRDDDLADYLDCESQPGHTLYLSREPYTEEEARKFIATSRDLPLEAEGTYLHLAIEHKTTGRVIGTSCIKVTSRAHRQGDMGWFLHAGCRGQGLATEASRAMLEFAFTTLDLHRITAHCDGENERSLLMAERLGMQREAFFRETVFFGGEWHSQHGLSILRREWETGQGRGG